MTLDYLFILTYFLFASISKQFEFVDVVCMLLSSPWSCQPLPHFHFLQLVCFHIFTHMHNAILGHLGQRTVLSQAAGLK